MKTKAHFAVISTAAALLAAALGLAAYSFTLWPVSAVVWLLLTVLFAQRLGWAMSLAGAFLTLVAAEVFLLRLLPATGIPLDVSHTVVWGVVGAALIVALGMTRSRLKLPDRSRIGVAVAATSAPLVATFMVLGAMKLAIFDRFKWAMNNDAVWTTMSARHIGTDGGVDTAAHMNSSPLAAALMAIGSAPGRSKLGEADWLRHDIAAEGALWVLIFLTLSLFVGLFVARSVPPSRPILRLVLAYLVGLFPFGWYVAGYMLMFGFYSATLSLVLMLAVIIVAREAFTSPVAGVSLLLLGSTAVLSTWAPLVVVPGVFAALVFFRNLKVFLSAVRPWLLGCWLAAAIQVAVYLVLVTMPDFAVDGGALANAGGTPSVSLELLGAFFVCALVSSLIVARARQSATNLLWLGALGLGLILGLAVLLWQTRNSNTPWSYYPSKFAWLATILLFVVAASNFATLLATYYRRRVLFIAIGLSGLFISTAVFSPLSSGLSSDELRGPFVNTVHSAQPVSTSTALLFALSAPSEKNLLSKYLATPSEDMRENLWLLQLSAPSGATRVRYFAYVMDPTNPRSVCTAIRAWGGGVTVRTTDPDWERVLRLVCRNTEFTVVVG